VAAGLPECSIDVRLIGKATRRPISVNRSLDMSSLALARSTWRVNSHRCGGIPAVVLKAESHFP
jgi:hypothetical protein